MNRTRVGGLLVGVGTVVLVLSAVADWIGLGAEGDAFGWKQAAGVIVGALVIVAGAFLVFRRRGA